MKKIVLSAAVAAWVLSGCGGTNVSEKKVAYYVDSAVEGVHYECDNGNKGTTGKDGMFEFGNATECTFSLAGIPLRSVKGAQLKEGTKVLEDDEKVAQLLQSLDIDGNPDNGGIKVNEEAFKKALEKAGLKDSGNIPEEEDLKKIIKKMSEVDKDYKGHFVTKAEAKKHAEETKGEIETEKKIQTSTKAFSIGALKTMYAKTKIKELIDGLKHEDNHGVKYLLEGRDDAPQCQSGHLTSTEPEHDSITVSADNCTYGKWKFDGAGYFSKSGGGSNSPSGKSTSHRIYEAKATKNITAEHSGYGKLTIDNGTFGRIDEYSTSTNTYDEESGKSEYKSNTASTIKVNGSFSINDVNVLVAGLLITTTQDHQNTDVNTEETETHQGKEKSTLTLKGGVFTLGEYSFTLDPSKTSTTTLNRHWNGDNDEDDTSTVSGAIYLKDGVGHAVEIAYKEHNTAVLKVDANGNGTFEKDEMLQIDREFIGY